MTIRTKEDLESFVSTHWEAINRQLDAWQGERPQPIYSSVDIRESATKYAPVDHNLYPAGFNNICKKDLEKAAGLFEAGIRALVPGAQRVGLLPESHTKNRWYLDNVYHLKATLEAAGFAVDLLTPDAALFSDGPVLTLLSQSEHQLELHQMQVRNGKVTRLSDPELRYDVIILNHDQSTPLNVEWRQVEIPVIPSPFAGWTRRQKNHHFTHYKRVADEFCRIFDIDPNLIQARYRAVENVDFETKEGLENLAGAVGELLGEIGVGAKVFAKASQGTYGMGITVFESRDEVLAMNRKTRNKMDVGKNNIKFTSVLVQEGVETIVKVEDAPAEITMYLVNGKSMGGFMRYNPQRGTNANLNSQGMLYKKFCISDVCQGTDTYIKEAVYCLIGRLSVLAASYELEDLQA